MERRSAKSVTSLSRKEIRLFQLIPAAVYLAASNGIMKSAITSFGLTFESGSYERGDRRTSDARDVGGCLYCSRYLGVGCWKSCRHLVTMHASNSISTRSLS